MEPAKQKAEAWYKSLPEKTTTPYSRSAAVCFSPATQVPRSSRTSAPRRGPCRHTLWIRAPPETVPSVPLRAHSAAPTKPHDSRAPTRNAKSSRAAHSLRRKQQPQLNKDARCCSSAHTRSRCVPPQAHEPDHAALDRPGIPSHRRTRAPPIRQTRHVPETAPVAPHHTAKSQAPKRAPQSTSYLPPNSCFDCAAGKTK